MNIQTALSWATKKLNQSSDSAALDSEVLLAHVLKRDKPYLHANPNLNLTEPQLAAYRILIRKRRRHWPVAYLTGHKEFFGLDFLITRDVLIPRPETELLVELALATMRRSPVAIRQIADIGTGSGNIVISLAKSAKNPKLKFFAVDSSAKALQIAKRNARRHGVANHIRFLRGNLLEPLLGDKRLAAGNSLIVANLPYGWKEWKNNMSTQTLGLKFEPQNALFSGEKGLKLIRHLLNQVAKTVSGGSVILVECDPRQKLALRRLAKKYLPRASVKFHKDLSGRLRILEICQNQAL